MLKGSCESPNGLMIELLTQPERAAITASGPAFYWIVRSARRDDYQSAYRILVATSPEDLGQDHGDMWDSGKVASDSSIALEYQGKTLSPGRSYFWKVKTWCKLAGESRWSQPQKFYTGTELGEYSTTRYPLCQTTIVPLKIGRKGDGHYLVDFGKAAFGYLQFDMRSPANAHPLEIHFGERGDANGINRNPGGSVRYYRVIVPLKEGPHSYQVHPPEDDRHTGGAAIRLPAEIGTIAPFRYVELVNCPVELTNSMIRQIAIHYPFTEDASSFESSDPLLNEIWKLCKYSMKATSFAGVYVDGDRERIPYEADAYINQLSHYAVDREYTLARYSHEYLLEHPTWPTEWKQHSILMAWADYMYTGNKKSLAQNYDVLKSEKTLERLARTDGLLNTGGLKDIVDWPAGERDGYDFREINTVVNAFYYKTLRLMADLAQALGKEDDAVAYRRKAVNVKTVFNERLFDTERGVYVDGEGSHHVSLHANMMPLAFGLVSKDRAKSVGDFVVSRGMVCSVYGAQYLLEALYEAGRPDIALERMTSRDLRSWYNMLRVGSTITLEAWDDRYKPNQDWNHAWGATPANIISRYLLGVRPMEPGFRKVLIQPQPGSLKHASAKIPSIRGPIHVAFETNVWGVFTLNLNIPANMTACVSLPLGNNPSTVLTVDGNKVEGQLDGKRVYVDGIGCGSHIFQKVLKAVN